MPGNAMQPAAGRQLEQALQQVRQRLAHSCLQQAERPGCVQPPSQPRTLHSLRLFQVEQFAFSDESLHERLTSLYDAMSPFVDSCFLLLEGTETGVTLSLGLRAPAPGAAAELFRASLEGNFPGIVLKQQDSTAIDQTMSRLESGGNQTTVSAVTLLPSERETGTGGEAGSVQGLEKFIDTMMGRRYTAIVLAAPYSRQTVEKRIAALETISTLLSPYAESTLQTSNAQALSLSDAVSSSVADSVVKNLAVGYSSTQTQSTFQQSGKGKGYGITPLGLGINWNTQTGTGSGTSQADGYNVTNGTAAGQIQTQGMTRTAGSTQTRTMSYGCRWKNKQVEDLLEQVDRQIKRLHAGGSYWDCAAYFIGEPSVSAMATSAYQALAAGRGTRNQSLCAVWQTLPGRDQSSNIRNLLACLRYAEPPRFRLPDGTVSGTDSTLPGSELPRMMGLPRQSVPGLSVTQMVPFGRSVTYTASRVQPLSSRQALLGQIVHMGKVTPQPVKLDLNALCAHALIVGGSGSGKTTVSCELLRSTAEENIPFTVVEPAKGEYKRLFGRLPGVKIYTTSPRAYRMLRINPFAFDPAVQLQDHIDRLIGAFSAAWPMYAAQPSLLRQCVEQAYVDRGWDLSNSVCRITDKDPFPTFRDLLEALPEVIRASHLVGETKGNYEGTLRARLNLLVSGVYGQIFCSGISVSDADLFESRTILDLSTIGSDETRALLMAVIISRLYEYRTAHPAGGSGLRHLTLLEEAHNILRAVPAAAASAEGGGASAQAAESLAKSIAELRYTGEAFLVVDQSPGILDPNAIKNTSTKIVMRLSYAEDQNAMAAAMTLTPQQAAQLARLPNGTAAVLQEGWAEPVLVQSRMRPHIWEEHGKAPGISYPALCRLRTFLLRWLLQQTARRQFDAAALQDVLLHRIQGLDPCQCAMFQELFAYYQSRYLRVQRTQKNFADPVCCLPFYGELMETLLSCEHLFRLCPLPHPTKEMQVPYSRNETYRQNCLNWQEQARQTLDLYTSGLTVEERDSALHCLLLYHGQTDTTAVLVSSVLYHPSSKP